jgi:hypothetical protein
MRQPSNMLFFRGQRNFNLIYFFYAPVAQLDRATDF